eukprot:1026893-Pleurochrysis_carterae.AAC.1
MPPSPPRSTRSPCRSAALACASGFGRSRGAEHCGRRCGNCRSRGRSRPRCPRGAASAAAASTPCGLAGRAQSQSCPELVLLELVPQ